MRQQVRDSPSQNGHDRRSVSRNRNRFGQRSPRRQTFRPNIRPVHRTFHRSQRVSRSNISEANRVSEIPRNQVQNYVRTLPNRLWRTLPKVSLSGNNGYRPNRWDSFRASRQMSAFTTRTPPDNHLRFKPTLVGRHRRPQNQNSAQGSHFGHMRSRITQQQGSSRGGQQRVPPRRKRGSKRKRPSGYRNSNEKRERVFSSDSDSDDAHRLKNDYSQHFVDTGQRPQNFIRETGLEDRLSEHPKFRELVRLKDEKIRDTNTPPMYKKCDLRTFDLSSLQSKFDVILIDPPWEEYSRRCPGAPQNETRETWSFEDMTKLKIPQIAASRAFLFIWSGSCEGLNQSRLLLKQWNFRRCEDIVWVKTNKTNQESSTHRQIPDSGIGTILRHSTEHCLMGIRGTVRRSIDTHFIHANVDIDVIVSEEPEPYGSSEKPLEIYQIIERFCLGRRRIELFGNSNNIRPGWITVGKDVEGGLAFDPQTYNDHFKDENETYLVPSSDRIEELRPRSPTRNSDTRGQNKKRF
uniref:N(6)-adenosine-methyltransferase non-catalytic subunit METTL14 n=2 Tax=Hirondellea gigas TaxID=1518452 RepID=A0A6A7G743_9CRUS